MKQNNNGNIDDKIAKLRSIGNNNDTPTRSTRGDTGDTVQNPSSSEPTGVDTGGTGINVRNTNAGRNRGNLSTPSDSGAKSTNTPTTSENASKPTKLANSGGTDLTGQNQTKGADKQSVGGQGSGKGGKVEGGGKSGKPSNLPMDKIKDVKEGDIKGALGKMLDEKGVHGDKDPQKQIEHALADKALYAIPGVNKVQAARDQLKKFNQGMKDAGLSDGDGVLDKLADASDKVVDKGIDVVKKGAVAGAAGSAVGTASVPMLYMMILSKALSAVKGFFASAWGAVAGFFKSVGSAIGGFFSGGVVAIAKTTVFVVSPVVAVGGVIVGLVIDDEPLQDDGILDCVPIHTTVNINVDEFVMEGTYDEMTWENVEKLYSVMKGMGGSDYAVAGLIGNMWHESGSLDPTAIETIYDEPFQIGPKKAELIANNFDVRYSFDANYRNGKYPKIVRVGRGLAQWTDTREYVGGPVAELGTRLIKYAEAHGQEWYTFELQMQYIVDVENGDTRAKKLKKIMEDSPFSNLHDATQQIAGTGEYGYIHNAALLNMEDRLDKAEKVYLEMERNNITYDEGYARGILDRANQNIGGANQVRNAYYKDDGCGGMVRDHYSNKAADGTGQVPSDVTPGMYYTPDNLPDSLREYAANPEDIGIHWGTSTGWHNVSGTGDQCTDLAQSYFIKLYRNDDPSGRAYGNGGVLADNWAKVYGSSATTVPVEGAIFQDKTTSAAGHTGIVQHVFANGDILIIEQNSGASGYSAGMKWSWNWRVVEKSTYESKGYKFFRPDGQEPKWHADTK